MMKWELGALKLLAKNPTVPGIALQDVTEEIERLREKSKEAQGQLSDYREIHEQDTRQMANMAQQIIEAQARIDELVPQCDAAYAPYREAVEKARAETDKFSAELQSAQAQLATYRAWEPELDKLHNRMADELKAANAALAMCDPLQFSSGHWRCQICGAINHHCADSGEHKEGCLWRKAREAK